MKRLAIVAMIGFSAPGCAQPGHSTADKATTMNKKRVIILCTGNSCRSQMAEAFWKKHGGDAWEAVSAGTKPSGKVSPLAVRAMAEKGIDISGYQSKGSGEFTKQHFDLVITVCDNADRECPAFANADQHLHWPFADPPKAPGDDDAKMKVCREVRDGIEKKISDYLRNEARTAAR